MGLAYYVNISGTSGLVLTSVSLTNMVHMGDHEPWQLVAHIIIYVHYVFGSIVFAKFWIETTNMGPEAVAKQIQDLVCKSQVSVGILE